MSVRTATREDATAIRDLLSTLGYEADDVASRLNEVLGRSDFFLAVAERGGGVVGWIAAEVQTGVDFSRRVEIVGLVVAESARRSGCGQELVAAVERWCPERNCSTVLVRSNVVRTESHPFYEKLGYARTKSQHCYRKTLGGATPMVTSESESSN